MSDILRISQFGWIQEHHHMMVKITFIDRTPLGRSVLIPVKKGTKQSAYPYYDEIDYLEVLFKLKKHPDRFGE